MAVDIRDIHSLSDFQRNTKQYATQLRDSRKPVVLTVNGKAALVVQDAEAYQEMLDELEIARSANVVKQRMNQFEQDGVSLNAKAALKRLDKDLCV